MKETALINLQLAWSILDKRLCAIALKDYTELARLLNKQIYSKQIYIDEVLNHVFISYTYAYNLTYPYTCTAVMLNVTEQ